MALFENLIQELVRVIPQIKSKLQLIAFAIIVAAMLIYILSTGDNLHLTLVSGTIGVCLLLFPLIIESLPRFRNPDIVLVVCFLSFLASIVTILLFVPSKTSESINPIENDKSPLIGQSSFIRLYITVSKENFSCISSVVELLGGSSNTLDFERIHNTCPDEFSILSNSTIYGSIYSKSMKIDPTDLSLLKEANATSFRIVSWTNTLPLSFNFYLDESSEFMTLKIIEESIPFINRANSSVQTVRDMDSAFVVLKVFWRDAFELTQFENIGMDEFTITLDEGGYHYINGQGSLVFTDLTNNQTPTTYFIFSLIDFTTYNEKQLGI